MMRCLSSSYFVVAVAAWSSALIATGISPDSPQPIRHRERFTRTEAFGFNIDWRDYYDHITITEDVKAEIFPAGLHGSIRMAPGERGQPNDFLVLVRIVASSEAGLHAISISNTTSEVLVKSASAAATSDRLVHDPVALDIILFARPGALQFGTTTISSNSLDIHISPDTQYESYHMNFKSQSGSIHGTDALRFVPHDITVCTTGSGSILGRWSLPSSISFITSHGPIDIILTPKRWSSGPTTLGDLKAHSASGNITIAMPFEPATLSLRNATTRIEAVEGSISAQLVHGAVTELSAEGDIDVSLLPYWAFSEWMGVQHNFILTESQRGHTNVRVLSPVVDSYYRTNPLWFAVSRHRQGKEGMGLKLSYPGEWAGNAEGRGTRAEIIGEEFERLEGNQTVVRARRRPMGSELLFEAEEAPAMLELEPCLGRNEFCSWQNGESEEL